MKKKLWIDAERCKACGLCLGACPGRCLQFSSRRNHAGYFTVEMGNSTACTACGICACTCPEPLCLCVSAKQPSFQIQHTPEDIL